MAKKELGTRKNVALFKRVVLILEEARKNVAHSVNTNMVFARIFHQTFYCDSRKSCHHSVILTKHSRCA